MEVFILILLIGGVIVFFAIKHSKQTTSSWAEAASKLRLNFENENFGYRRIHGKRVDLVLEIKTEQVGKTSWTSYQAEFAESLPFSLNLAQQSFFTDVKNALLNKIDLESGDSAFDRKIIVESRRSGESERVSRRAGEIRDYKTVESIRFVRDERCSY